MVAAAEEPRSRSREEQVDLIVRSAEFRALYRHRERIRWLLSGIAFGIAAAFTSCMAFAPALISHPLSNTTSITWGLVLTVASLVLGTATGAAYIYVAERLFGNDTLEG